MGTVKPLQGSPHREPTASTYISMKMEPNGRIPPRQTMTAGSMNLGGHNIQH